MALSEQEKQTLRELSREGHSRSEIMGYVADKRLGRPASTPGVEEAQVRQAQEQERGFFNSLQNTITDIPSDLKEGFQASKQTISENMDQASQVASDVVSGEESLGRGTARIMGEGFQAGTEVLGHGGLTIGKAFLPPSAEKAISEGFGSAVQSAAESETGQSAIRAYQGLDEDTQTNIETAGKIAEGVTTLFGFGPLASRVRSQVSDKAGQLLEESDNVLQRMRQRQQTETQSQTTLPSQAETQTGQGIIDRLNQGVRDVRFELSDVDPKVQTVLEQPDTTMEDVRRHFRHAERSAANDDVESSFQMVANKATQVYDSLEESKQKAIQAKNEILTARGDERVSGGLINQTYREAFQTLPDAFGVTIKNGEVVEAPGRTSKLSSRSDERLVEEYMQRLDSLGVSPTMRQVDDFVDWAQGKLYKASESKSDYSAPTEKTVGVLRGVTGNLNARLKQEIGLGYGDVNLRIQRLNDLQEEISKGLGADARKGAGFVKRLSSPSSDQTRRVFQEIKEETGVDLFKETRLAEFAMEAAGDSRQRSLLREVSEQTERAADVELTNLSSILRFAREKLDMDAEELAEEIIRRRDADTPGRGDTSLRGAGATRTDTDADTAESPTGDGVSDVPENTPPQSDLQSRLPQSVDGFERMPNLTDENRKIETAAFKKIMDDAEGILADYKANNGRTVNTDDFRDYFRDVGYNGANSMAVHKPSQFLAAITLERNLQNPEDFFSVIAGGSGAGKSSAIKNVQMVSDLKQKSAAVLDSNFDNYDSAIKKIKQATDKGKTPIVNYVYRDPIDAFENGVIKRMLGEEGGRSVPISVVAETHVNAFKTARRLQENKDAFVNYIDNSLGVDSAEVTNYGTLKDKVNLSSVEDLEQQLRDKAKELYARPEETKQRFGRAITEKELEQLLQ